MIKSKYIWKKKVEEVVSDDLIFKTLLMNRNISDYDTFFSMGKERLHNPFLLNDMQKSIDRIRKAIESKEKILIFGDYDCDGISSIVLLYRALKQINANVDYDLPDRFNEGYGLNERAVAEIIKKDVKLVITVDNGITCVQEVKTLNEAGIDIIITDHHEPAEVIPKAFAIIHPKLSPNYPFKEIAGVMVAYKLASALLESDLDDLIDLAMIGTIADLMPLEDENQAIVNLGIEIIKQTKNIGLKKLIEFSNLDLVNVTAIAFKIAPKINSSGRLNKAKEAIELLITDDIKRANDLIYDIEKNHDLRKKLTEDAFNICEANVNPDDSVLIVASHKLHEGVIGICAQKLVEKYQKSTVVIAIDEDNVGKGSARGFGEANILEMLNNNAKYLTKFGGHSQAAGLQLSMENINDFRVGMNTVTITKTSPILNVDMEVYLPEVKVKTIKNIQEKSFFTATYVMKGLKVIGKQSLNNKHTKLQLEIDGYFIEALDFNNMEFYYNLNLNDKIDICGGLNVNSYRSKDSLQILIKDIQCLDMQIYDFRKAITTKIDNYFNVVYYSDENIIENSNILDEVRKKKSVLLLPRTKKYNLNQLIDRRELGNVYRTLAKLDKFKFSDLDLSIFSEFIYENAIKIFSELGLLTNEEEHYKISKNAVKLNLQQSAHYLKLLETFQHITFIYQSELINIKEYFIKILEA